MHQTTHRWPVFLAEPGISLTHLNGFPYFAVAQSPQVIEHATSLGAKALMSNSDMEDPSGSPFWSSVNS
ncbi:MAG: hypothetical protein ABJ059_08950 [Hyphomicrobiales bacterium]